MLRKFKITIDGKEYLVEMEEVGAENTKNIPEKKEKVAVKEPASEPSAERVPTPSTSADTNQFSVKAPMPGSVLKIEVNAGETVKENQVLLILEAMKMENEIVAEKAGRIESVQVAEGASVNSGDLLLTIQ